MWPMCSRPPLLQHFCLWHAPGPRPQHWGGQAIPECVSCLCNKYIQLSRDSQPQYTQRYWQLTKQVATALMSIIQKTHWLPLLLLLRRMDDATSAIGKAVRCNMLYKSGKHCAKLSFECLLSQCCSKSARVSVTMNDCRHAWHCWPWAAFRFSTPSVPPPPDPCKK
jgi:hypothetical protein